MNYYNENDPQASAWLKELIAQGALPDGVVDDRSIEDVTPIELEPYVQCHFFAGIGGWPYALQLAGWPEDRPVWTGSAPCQPFSAAGKGGGIADERHLWPALFWLISQCRPAIVFGEQVASSDALGWWDVVSTDLEAADYACGGVDLCAAGVGAFHLRQRLYWVGTLANTQVFDSGNGNTPETWYARQKRNPMMSGSSTPTSLSIVCQMLTPWPPASARDWKSSASNKHGDNARPLNEVARLTHGDTPTGSPAETAKPGQLNPAFSRWLMGFPPIWCVAAILAYRQMKRRKPEL